MFALSFVYTAVFSPFAIFLLRTYFLAIPKEFEEAGVIDGANRCAGLLQCASPARRHGGWISQRLKGPMSIQTKSERIRGGSFDRKSLFVTFHEGRKAMNIPLIGSYRRAIVPCKDFVGEIGFQGCFLFLAEHIGGKQCDSPW